MIMICGDIESWYDGEWQVRGHAIHHKQYFVLPLDGVLLPRVYIAMNLPWKVLYAHRHLQEAKNPMFLNIEGKTPFINTGTNIHRSTLDSSLAAIDYKKLTGRELEAAVSRANASQQQILDNMRQNREYYHGIPDDENKEKRDHMRDTTAPWVEYEEGVAMVKEFGLVAYYEVTLHDSNLESGCKHMMHYWHR